MSRGRKPTVADDELIAAIREHDDRAVTTNEVAALVDIKRAGTYERLKQLAERGEIEKKDVGSRAVVWWVND